MSTGSSTQVTRRGVFPRLRDARIRAKLALILVVPLVAVIIYAPLVRFTVAPAWHDLAARVKALLKKRTPEPTPRGFEVTLRGAEEVDA